MGAQQLKTTNLKVSVFLDRYFPDDESRPCQRTIINHINQGMISGKKVGGLYFVTCTEWGDPLFWHSARPATHQPVKANTGNQLADKIIKRHFR